MAAIAKRKSVKKSSMVTFRIPMAEKSLIAKAAKAENLEQSAYVRKSLIKQAQMDLADRNEFLISPEAMENFLAILDRPIQKEIGLQKLLNEKSILD